MAIAQVMPAQVCKTIPTACNLVSTAMAISGSQGAVDGAGRQAHMRAG